LKDSDKTDTPKKQNKEEFSLPALIPMARLDIKTTTYV